MLEDAAQCPGAGEFRLQLREVQFHREKGLFVNSVREEVLAPKNLQVLTHEAHLLPYTLAKIHLFLLQRLSEDLANPNNPLGLGNFQRFRASPVFVVVAKQLREDHQTALQQLRDEYAKIDLTKLDADLRPFVRDTVPETHFDEMRLNYRKITFASAKIFNRLFANGVTYCQLCLKVTICTAINQ